MRKYEHVKPYGESKLVRTDSRGRIALLNEVDNTQWYYVRQDPCGVVSLIPTGVRSSVGGRRYQQKKKAEVA